MKFTDTLDKITLNLTKYCSDQGTHMIDNGFYLYRSEWKNGLKQFTLMCTKGVY